MQVAGKKGRREELSYGGHCEGKRACAFTLLVGVPTNQMCKSYFGW